MGRLYFDCDEKKKSHSYYPRGDPELYGSPKAFQTPGSGRILAAVSGLLFTALVFALAGGVPSGQSQPPTAPEYQIKAAYLYNFAKFVEWPSPAGELPDPIVVGVLGKDPFGPVLEETLLGKSVNGRPFVVRRFASLKALKPCQILFISSSEKGSLTEIFKGVENQGVLTVGETERFARLGGIINFTLEENKVHFEINLDAATRSGLKISSQLLKLGRVMRGGRGAGRG